MLACGNKHLGVAPFNAAGGECTAGDNNCMCGPCTPGVDCAVHALGTCNTHEFYRRGSLANLHERGTENDDNDAKPYHFNVRPLPSLSEIAAQL